MKTTELQSKLLEAYTTENLNGLSLVLINLYKNQQYATLRKIAEIISDTTKIEIADDGKGFSTFMMLYHPDKSVCHINEINKLAAHDNYDGLLEYTHVLKLSRIEEIATSIADFEDIDYAPVYEWDYTAEGVTIIHEKKHSKRNTSAKVFYNFYDGIKIRMFGNTHTEYPSYYLEDIDEFELSSSNINDLEGVEFCIHAKTMDLSDNYISDLTPLFGLSLLEELNLADNKIECIDALNNLENLECLDLSNNKIEDISPLFDLDWLNYVDLRGNNVSKQQVEKLRHMGITVDA
jgi:Leucine-rich repeat (LRR) protein